MELTICTIAHRISMDKFNELKLMRYTIFDGYFWEFEFQNQNIRLE